MRRLRAEDNWRGLYKRKYRHTVTSLQFTNVSALGAGEVFFRGGITALCGGNGTGKSTLLNAVCCAIDEARSPKPDLSRLRLSNAEFVVKGTAANEPFVFATKFADGRSLSSETAESIELLSLDPSADGERISSLVRSDAAFSDILESLTPRSLGKEELLELSQLTGKKYETCEIFEIEEYAQQPPFPYFRVALGGTTYGSDSMGAGELCLILIYWRLLTVSENSLLLIEEPEAHLPPSSQGALADILADVSLRRGVWIVITTHSNHILERIPLNHIRLLYRRDGDAFAIVDSPSALQLDATLRVRRRIEGVLAVEDEVARLYCGSLLRRLDSDMYYRCEIAVAGSEGEIRKAVEHFPRAVRMFWLLGLFDGDVERETVEEGWVCSFLPGTTGPESLLRGGLVGRTGSLAERLGITPETLDVAIATLADAEDHDWLLRLQEYLGISLSQLIDALTEVWLEEADNVKSAEEMVDSIRKLAV